MPSSLDGLLTLRLGCASVSNLADPGDSSAHYEEMLYLSSSCPNQEVSLALSSHLPWSVLRPSAQLAAGSFGLPLEL